MPASNARNTARSSASHANQFLINSLATIELTHVNAGAAIKTSHCAAVAAPENRGGGQHVSARRGRMAISHGVNSPPIFASAMWNPSD
jgi:hypothetical protein